MELKDLVGLHFLSGVNEVQKDSEDYHEKLNGIAFCLDGKSYAIYEDPSDGFRSYCRELEEYTGNIHNHFAPEQMFCAMDSNDNNYLLRVLNIETAESILIIGTENYDDSYPCAIMSFYPENMQCNKIRKK
jgi:hypothetical protein